MLDRLLGDPRRLHPVAGFGVLAAALERRLWHASKLAGAAYVALLVGAVAATASITDRALAGRPAARLWLRTAAVWATLGGRSLERAATALGGHVQRGELDAARALAPTLVGRDPAGLDGPELCRAALESVAENTCDAVVAPLLWAGAFGIAGAAGYRAINTLDAMVGHRSERHLRFGWAAARLDDAVNWPAARVSALLAALLAPTVGGSVTAACRAAFTGGALRHPSPNAGRVEGAFAGALGVRLGGVNRYGHGVEHRPELGHGPLPGARDIERAAALARRVGATAALLAAGLAWGRAR